MTNPGVPAGRPPGVPIHDCARCKQPVPDPEGSSVVIRPFRAGEEGRLLRFQIWAGQDLQRRFLCAACAQRLETLINAFIQGRIAVALDSMVPPAVM